MVSWRSASQLKKVCVFINYEFIVFISVYIVSTEADFINSLIKGILLCVYHRRDSVHHKEKFQWVVFIQSIHAFIRQRNVISTIRLLIDFVMVARLSYI